MAAKMSRLSFTCKGICLTPDKALSASRWRDVVNWCRSSVASVASVAWIPPEDRFVVWRRWIGVEDEEKAVVALLGEW